MTKRVISFSIPLPKTAGRKHISKSYFDMKY